ncbi:hypothetical protein AAK967_05455 [Atopobiaceae bacterium 24-176]
MDDEELGLPTPQQPEGDRLDVPDYTSEEYADARTLEEAIAIRGAKAFLRDLAPDDFSEDGPLGSKKIGTAELWAESTWEKGETVRDVECERLAVSVKEGDLLEVRPCLKYLSDWGYRFHLVDGSALPYSPYHDYDDLFFERSLDGLGGGERLVCRVEGVSCFGEDGVSADPDFCWRVYLCKVTVYRCGATRG